LIIKLNCLDYHDQWYFPWYLPLIIHISDTCKNQPKRLDFDNTINLSSLIVILGWRLINLNCRQGPWFPASILSFQLHFRPTQCRLGSQARSSRRALILFFSQGSCRVGSGVFFLKKLRKKKRTEERRQTLRSSVLFFSLNFFNFIFFSGLMLATHTTHNTSCLIYCNKHTNTKHCNPIHK
jgi:hypothetical protein